MSYNKFFLLLRKVIYLYEYTYSWKRFHETFSPDIEPFYSNLNLEDFTDADHKHAIKV